MEINFRFFRKQLLTILGFKSDLSEYAWYLGYGSNILDERFIAYITGGQIKGNKRQYQGCRNRSLPLLKKNRMINHEMYFAKESPAWDNGGIAFINVNSDPDQITFARMYLITKEQLCDVAKQETNSSEIFNINFNEAITQGYTIFKDRSWYGKLIYLGREQDYPIFTLTNQTNLTQTTKPSSEYLQAIALGIKKNHRLSHSKLVDYFICKRGVLENYTDDELLNIFDMLNSS